MKPSIPDTGMVIKLDGDQAVVRMKHEGSCRKCGAAAIGLCKAGQMQVVTVRNSRRARVGDTVKIGLARDIQSQGYLLAFGVPPVALVAGIVVGHVLGVFAGFAPLDIIAGFSLMIAASFLSFRRLNRLASSSSIEIVNILAESWERRH
jgi:positive regulator of sigma E activity